MDFFSIDNFGKYINIAIQTTRRVFKISDPDLVKKSEAQFFNSEITYNVPQFMLEKKSTTLNDFDKDFFPYPLEIPYFFNCLRTNNCDIYKNFFLEVFNKEFKSDIKIFNEEETFAKRINLLISLTKYFINPEAFPTEGKLIKMIKNSLFQNIKKEYTKSDFILGGEDEYMKILNNGSFYENFKKNKKNFSGFPIEEKEKQEKDYEVNIYSMFTGRNSIDNNSLRTISKINNERIFNFKKNIYDKEGNEFSYRIPLLKGKKLIEFSDGFQYSTKKNYIYYYDKFSSNVLGFEFKNSKRYNNNIECDFFQLNEVIETPLNEDYIANSIILNNTKNTLGNAFERFDRPMIIGRTDRIMKTKEWAAYSKINVNYSQNYNYDITSSDFEKSNFICVDKFSDFVVVSNIRLTYAMLLKSYNNFNDNFSKEVLVPLFDYTRTMNLSEESYRKEFPNNVHFYNLNKTVILLGLVFVVGFMALAIYFILKYKNEAKLEYNNENEILLS